MSKCLVDVHRYHKLEQLLSDVLAVNCAVSTGQAKHYIKQAISTAAELDKQPLN